MTGFTSGLWTVLWMAAAAALPDGDLCRWMNGRKYYVEAGESGTVTLRNVTGGESRGRPGLPGRCGVELVTCPSCHLIVTVLYLNVPACGADGSCGCDYLWIREPAYSRSGREFCGFSSDPTSHVYRSQTKTVSVDFLYSYSYSDAFSLRFAAGKNLYRVTGSHLGGPSEAGGTLSTPFFPASVPGDYAAEFVLDHREPDGFVQLLFVDFRLSPGCLLQIYDTNGTRIDEYDASVFRPPATSSSGPTLSLKFRCHRDPSSSGFKAEYSFVNYPDKYWSAKPVTECGGSVDDFGGAITVTNAAEGKGRRVLDCLWLIRPRSGRPGHTRLAVRLAQFRDLGMESSLEIRRGQTSESPLLETVSGYRRPKNSRGREYVVPSSTGFYVRLKGSFGNASYLAITYVSFTYDDCYAGGDFECANGRCVSHTLRCDGFNHCADGTDEATCFGSNKGVFKAEEAGWWRTMTPNYYFPKPGVSNGTGTNTLILVTSLAGLGMFILTTVTVLIKLHGRRRRRSGPQILRTVSGDLDRANNPANGNGRRSDPPGYDPPPSYRDVMKYYLPPPPAYSSIMERDHRRPYPASVINTEGYTNSAFVSDNRRADEERIRQNENRRELLARESKLPSPPTNANRPNLPPSDATKSADKVRRAKMLSSSSRNKTKAKSRWHPGWKESASACNCRGACSCPSPGKFQIRKTASDRQPTKIRAKTEKLRRFASVPFSKSLANIRELKRSKSHNKEANVSPSGENKGLAIRPTGQLHLIPSGTSQQTPPAQIDFAGRLNSPDRDLPAGPTGISVLRKVASQPDLRVCAKSQTR